MAELFFFDGAFHQMCGDEAEGLPPGAQVVPRAPELGETWDPATGTFVLDPLARVEAGLGAGHVGVVHPIKALEAAVILSGVPLTHGFLAEEAAALGVGLLDLAAQVHAKAAALRSAEIARRQAKAQK